MTIETPDERFARELKRIGPARHTRIEEARKFAKANGIPFETITDADAFFALERAMLQRRAMRPETPRPPAPPVAPPVRSSPAQTSGALRIVYAPPQPKSVTERWYGETTPKRGW